MGRVPLSKSKRYRVLERDSFTFQYCGASAPSVELVVDHITPVAHGGSNDLTNLATACQPCNAGKGTRAAAKRVAARIVGQEKREALEEAVREMCHGGSERGFPRAIAAGFTEAEIWIAIGAYQLCDCGEQDITRALPAIGRHRELESYKRANQNARDLQSRQMVVSWLTGEPA